MNIAKASDSDIDMAIDLSRTLEDLESGFMPVSIATEDETFDCKNHDDCHAALNLILSTLQRGSIGRVIWGMAALCDPESKILNPDSDIIERHPSLSDRQDRQTKILQWTIATFGQATADNTGERIRRFLEEALELAQAVGLDQDAAQNMVEYVYSRPTGHVNQEIGQVGVSLLALSEHLHINAEHEEFAEFQRITSLPADHWQSRQNAKAGKGIALASSADPE
ncbi:hypothetical protein [Methylomonas sp. HYX-M1]|uniref:hypothetical protein n=1 Tax=Methylomonas sp. HYX-M1 TaxID=3139307 RepID=UPI00345BE7EB